MENRSLRIFKRKSNEDMHTEVCFEVEKTICDFMIIAVFVVVQYFTEIDKSLEELNSQFISIRKSTQFYIVSYGDYKYFNERLRA